ncbi:MAG TPA: biotin-dependent carboxyltransferase family protein [Stellaceae bacterium]|nr:biotin-dependent carboxyltransferase family protein [Stellaceae bacterium]
MTAVLRVIAAGPLATVQDGGRTGWLRSGVPGSGALDPRALALANLLVGNRPDAGALELTLAGGTFVAEGAMRIALAGAAMPLAIDGAPAAPAASHTLRPGAVVTVGAARTGARAYLAVAGGFALAPVFGSVATHFRAGIGGLAGRALKAGDALPVAGPVPAGPDLRFAGAAPPEPPRIRVVPGPQDDHFTPEALATLVAAAFTITAEADRMGYRLAGPKLAHARDFNIVSDGIAPGSIQVPGNGQPIVLLADRQTTGGYPKIATVVSADLPALGQMRPGDTVRFAAVGLAEAAAARRALADWLAELPRRIVPAALDPARLLAANLISGVTDGSG